MLHMIPYYQGWIRFRTNCTAGVPSVSVINQSKISTGDCLLIGVNCEQPQEAGSRGYDCMHLKNTCEGRRSERGRKQLTHER